MFFKVTSATIHQRICCYHTVLFIMYISIHVTGNVKSTTYYGKNIYSKRNMLKSVARSMSPVAKSMSQQKLW